MGESYANLAKYDADNRQIRIILRVERSVREDLSRLAGIRVPTLAGTTVPLAGVADVALATGPTQITRYGRQYRVTIEADLADGVFLGTAMKAINALPIVEAMPEGTAIQPSGDAEAMADVFSQFGLAMGAGLLLVYVVLVLLFSSFVTPITILTSLPLAIGGAIFALYLYGAGIGLPQVIGFLMLMGIVSKNAIMLVEFGLEAIASGVDETKALLDAGHKRARPIVMTTLAMSAGMIPSALAFGEGGEFRAPMAIAVIGGLLVSTLLSLLFVPSLFSLISGFRDGLVRKVQAIMGTNRPQPW